MMDHENEHLNKKKSLSTKQKLELTNHYTRKMFSLLKIQKYNESYWRFFIYIRLDYYMYLIINMIIIQLLCFLGTTPDFILQNSIAITECS